MQYGVKLRSGVLYGPYTRNEARRVANTINEPSDIIVLVDGIEDPVLSRKVRRSEFWRSPMVLAFTLLCISVYFGQGPGVLATLIWSPRAYDNIPKAADLPQTSDEFTVLQRKHMEDWEIVAMTTY